MSTKATSMQNLCIVYFCENAYRVNSAFMSKDEAVNLIKSSNITSKKGMHLNLIK